MTNWLPKPDDRTQHCHGSLFLAGRLSQLVRPCSGLGHLSPLGPMIPSAFPSFGQFSKPTFNLSYFLVCRRPGGQSGWPMWGEASSGSTAQSTQMALWPPSFVLPSLPWAAPAACQKGLLGSGHSGCWRLVWASAVGAGLWPWPPGGATPWCGSEWQQVALPGLTGHTGLWLLL